MHDPIDASTPAARCEPPREDAHTRQVVDAPAHPFDIHQWEDEGGPAIADDLLSDGGL